MYLAHGIPMIHIIPKTLSRNFRDKNHAIRLFFNGFASPQHDTLCQATTNPLAHSSTNSSFLRHFPDIFLLKIMH